MARDNVRPPDHAPEAKQKESTLVHGRGPPSGQGVHTLPQAKTRVNLFTPEQTGLAKASDHWLRTKDGDPHALELFLRHYSGRQYRDGRIRKLFVGPGEKMVLISPRGDAVFIWRKFLDDSGQTGINNAVFRNEGPVLASTLIKEAMAIAWGRWPGERLYTYVNPKRIRSTIPGYCFRRAGWKRVGETRGGLLIFDEELPRGFQDGDLEMADLVRQGIDESKLRRAGKCPHGWYKAPAGEKAKCHDCGKEFESEAHLLEEREDRLAER